MADFDAHSLIDHASDFLVSYAAEEWRESYNHTYPDEIDRVVTALSTTLRERFADWVRQIPIPDPAGLGSRKVSINKSATFLNFNYTPSLQKLYGVANDNILHIHGAATDSTDELVLGHGWKRSAKDSFSFGVDPEDFDTRVLQGNKVIDRYFSATFKPTARIIADRQPFFGALYDVGQINVIGHSLADVDRPYFDEVLRHIDRNVVDWRVSYHGANSDVSRARFDVLGVPPARVSFLRLEEF